MTPTENFLSRLPQSAPPGCRQVIEVAGRLVDNFRSKVATIRKDPTLSPQGQKERIRDALAGGFSEHFGQLRSEVDRGIAGIATEVIGLKKRTVDLLGEGSTPELRRECRDRLQEKDLAERRRIALETDDKLIKSAILEGKSGFLSGLDQEVFSLVEQRIVEETFGERLAELKVDHEAWTEAATALRVAAGQLQREAEINAAEFEKLAA